MKTPSKAALLAENAELKHAVGVRDEYLMHAFRGEVSFTSKGRTRLGICGETRAHGGVVLEAFKDVAGVWHVAGVYYWESFYEKARNFPVRHDDTDGQDRRTCASQVAAQVAKKQADFYAPKVAAACKL